MSYSLQAAIDRLMSMEDTRRSRLSSVNVRDWMVGAVVPVVEALAKRREFRAQARWSLENLVPGLRTEARVMVDAVDRALVTHAKAIVDFAAVPEAQRALQQVPVLPGKWRDLDGLVWARAVAARPWLDLVSARDYFARDAGLNLRPSPDVQRSPQFVDFVPGFVQALRGPGDYVADMALRRAQFWHGDLARCCIRCQNAAGSDPSLAAPMDPVNQSSALLARSIAELQTLLTTGAAANQRHACTSLIQAYAAYHPKPDLSWLRLPADGSPRGMLAYWVEREDRWIAKTIAAALCTVAEMYRRDLTLEERLEEAAETHRLVLGADMGARYLFWEEQRCDETWLKNDAMWIVLENLALCGLRGRGVDIADFGRSMKRHTLVSRVSRLKKLLPASLAACIQPSSRYAYSVELEPQEIFVFPMPSGRAAEIQDLLAQVGPLLGGRDANQNR